MAGYLGAIPVPQATQHRESFTATAGQTTFNTAGYTVGFVDVYLNGVHLTPADVTATNGSDVVLGACLVNDIVDVISYTAFEVNSQTFTGTTTMDVLTTTGVLTTTAGDGITISNSGNTFLQLKTTGTTATNFIEFKDSGGSAGSISYNHTDNYLATKVNGSERMRIISSGNVGINVTAPAFPLTVGGTTLIKCATDDNIRISQQTHASVQAINDAANAFTELKLDGSSLALNSQSGGNVGVNVTAPTAPLTIKADSSARSIRVVGRSDDISEIDFMEADDSTLIARLQARATFFSLGTIANVPLVLRTNDTDRVTVANSGAVTFTSNIILGDAKSVSFGDQTVAITGDGTAETLKLFTSNLERVRLNAAGSLLVGATGSESGTSKLFAEYSSQASASGLELHDNSAGTNGLQIAFYKQTAVKGSITSNSSSTSYNTSSDYRLKTDAKPMTGASDRVLALKPINFKWIIDGSRVDGFLAHEAQEVVPEAVTGTKDAMRDEEYEVTPAVLDDDGNETKKAVMGTRSVPDMQGIDQSKMVPLLVAALQEALARITALENA